MDLQPRRILWPTDFSETSLQAARYARALCNRFGAQLHVLHVVPPPVNPDVNIMFAGEVPMIVSESDLSDASRRGLKRLVEKHLDNDAGVVCDVSSGNPWTAICEYAGKHEIDMIVITTHGRTGITHALIGSTAERVVQHAPCPVLTVKNKERNCLKEG